MSTNLPFFPDEATYRKWIQSMPGILRVEKAKNGTFDEKLDVDTAGPYFVAPGSEWLILRVGFPYRVVHRVQAASEADFAWYVARTKEEGEKVYAAYLRDSRTHPARIVSGSTLQAALGALTEYLSYSQRPRATRLLTRKLSQGTETKQ